MVEDFDDCEPNVFRPHYSDIVPETRRKCFPKCLYPGSNWLLA
jgi:hypothetical protein